MTVWRLLMAGGEMVLRRKRLLSYPLAVKIDISPRCNLKCTVCVHAHANGDQRLACQQFDKSQDMTLANFRRIIDQIRGRTAAVTLYYLGDPLIHPQVTEMCQVASEAGLCVQCSSNFSYPLSDERIDEIVASGVTHLRICIDGLEQKTYERTRVGGKIDLVIANLRRLVAAKRRLKRKFPKIEVQYIKFQHNVHELTPARILCEQIGADQFTSFWGNLGNYVDANPGCYPVRRAKRRRWYLPRCVWPYVGMLIKQDGDVLPCCNHRQGEQYAAGGDCRALGNVFETSVREVWNSPAYQEIRRLSWNPRLSEKDDRHCRSFCESCPNLFHADLPELRGNRHMFDQVYVLDERGVPVRRKDEST